jgi:hypothetical protein
MVGHHQDDGLLPERRGDAGSIEILGVGRADARACQLVTQGAHDAKVATLVGKETQIAHARSGRLQDDGFVGQSVSGIPRGLNVGAGEARVSISNRLQSRLR